MRERVGRPSSRSLPLCMRCGALVTIDLDSLSQGCPRRASRARLGLAWVSPVALRRQRRSAGEPHPSPGAWKGGSRASAGRTPEPHCWRPPCAVALSLICPKSQTSDLVPDAQPCEAFDRRPQLTAHGTPSYVMLFDTVGSLFHLVNFRDCPKPAHAMS